MANVSLLLTPYEAKLALRSHRRFALYQEGTIMANVSLSLTPYEAKLLWGVVDGAADAGACRDGSGNSEEEAEALNEISLKLLKHRAKWKDAN